MNSDESFKLRKFDVTQQPSGGAIAVRQGGIRKLLMVSKFVTKRRVVI